MKAEINRFKFDTDDIKAQCPEHPGPIVDVPHMIESLNLSEQDHADALIGMWGLGWCPVGQHYEVWRLPEYNNRPGATETNPFGNLPHIPLDKKP